MNLNTSSLVSATAGVFLAVAGLAGATAGADVSIEKAETVLRQQSDSEVRHYSTRDFGRERYSGAISVLVSDGSAESLLQAVRPLLPPGYVAFLGTSRSLAQPPESGVEVVVGPGTSQFDILRIAASDATNYDKQTEDLIKVLQNWDRRYGIDIFAAETDTIQFKLKTSPADLLEFAKEVYEFCPDIVDQGVGSVSALAAEIRASGRVFLWWD